ncbi:MAG: hypothetical protein A2Y89_02855 [Chloroflexi bacterium RBG_13_51_18]|nr:MAG: hypothetical protein A2Y89_02855 [Chloroflexi bacterium RBG_13_51_18]
MPGVYSRIVTRLNKTWQPFYLGLKSKVIRLVELEILPFFRRWNLYTFLAIAGIIAPVILVVGDLTAAFASPGYSLIENSISSLALTKIGWMQTIGFLFLGLLVEVFTAGLLFNIKGSRLFYLGIAFFVIFGFAMLLIGAFRTDPIGAERTIEGRIHGLTAQTAFTIFPAALLFLFSSIKKDPNWKRLFRYTFITLILAVVLIIVIRVAQEPNSVFGLMERLLVVNMILWVEIAAINLFVLSLKRGQ